MADEATAALLREQLFADPDLHVYAVLDGASVGPALLDHLYGEEELEFCCLIPGQLESDVAEVSPYLAELDAEAEFTDWLLREGWGKHWGLFALAPEPFPRLREHFRSLVLARGPDLRPVEFRFYDPRVLPIFLPTCDAAQAAEVFGPVGCYLLEGEAPSILLRIRPLEAGERQREPGFAKIERTQLARAAR